MTFTVEPLFPGLLRDAASRLAADVAAGRTPASVDAIADMGWPALLVAEAYGGAGGSLADLAAIVEGLAAQTLNLPVIERCAIVPALLQGAVPAERSPAWLRALAEGTARIAPLAGPSADLCETALTATAQAGGWRLQGEAAGVHAPDGATHYIAIANEAAGRGTDGKLALFILPADALPPPRRRFTSMDGHATADFVLDGVDLHPEARLASGDTARAAVRAAEQLALAATCIEMVATLACLVEQTVAHLNARVQFGVALSTFQALRHRLVDVYLRYESARGMVAQLVRSALVGAPDHERRLRLAKVAIGESARFAAEAAIQLHGGMGMSHEVLAARLSQRLLASEFRYGDRYFHGTTLLARRRESV